MAYTAAMQPPSASLYDELLARAGFAFDDTPPRPSAAIVPWRRVDGRLEVYWVRRAASMQFMGGWHAFPGGGLAPHDVAVPVAGLPAGSTATSVSDPLPDLDDDARARLGPDLVPGLTGSVLRELFEETGLLLTRKVWQDDPDDAGRERLQAARQRLLNKEARFADLVAGLGSELTAEPLVFAGRWLTPPLAPLRFDNRFFLLEWPAERRLQPELAGGELDHGEWIDPGVAWRRYQAGDVLAAPPIVHLLTVLAEDGPEVGLPRLRDPREANLGPFRRVEFRPGVLLLPLRTPTLPPATHTNAFLLGHGDCVLVDPASPIPSEIDRLLRALAAAAREGRRLRALWLTHHHADHVGAVEALRSELGVPVLAHPLAAEPLARQGIALDGHLHDGQEILLEGDPPFPVQVLHTPGHTRGHLAFLAGPHRSLLAGDLVAGLGSIVIDPPEGDMQEYLDSLERMIALAPETVFPAHGPVLFPAVARLAEARDHRLWREAKIEQAWSTGRRTPEAMVEVVYDDVPAALHPIARRQILAHLERLRRLGRLSEDEAHR